jgi:small subunit ribosomal protein S21
MAAIRVKEHESYDSAMRRFKRSVEKSGTLAEAKRRQYHEKSSAKRKRLKAAAVKRSRKQTFRDGFSLNDRRKNVS